MQRFDLIAKLKQAEDNVSSLQGDIRRFVDEFVKANKKFNDGQKVEVFDAQDRSIGVGFIRSAMCGVNFRWGFRPNYYIGEEDRWLKDLSDIMYEVVKCKKDGTPSERTLLWDKPREEKRHGYYYLKAVE